jgi:hypothetical protein
LLLKLVCKLRRTQVVGHAHKEQSACQALPKSHADRQVADYVEFLVLP